MPENVVYVGKKPTMSYVFAVVTQFNSNASRVAIKARGNSIQKAVDAAEIVRNRFVPGARVEGVAIGSEELANEDGTKSNVSSIHIVLGK
ncbi:MAG: DNA-binding protein Alba [Candidatus Micrarchaeota archaeon]|nr:DNA-binding protein Alba [Candidatus Micrarchaeota archaeon]